MSNDISSPSAALKVPLSKSVSGGVTRCWEAPDASVLEHLELPLLLLPRAVIIKDELLVNFPA